MLRTEISSLAMSSFNRSQLIGQQLKITLLAYWHLSDVAIDMNPDVHLPENWDKWSLDQNALVIYYTIGDVKTTSSKGYGSNWLIEPPLHSYASLTFTIETL